MRFRWHVPKTKSESSQCNLEPRQQLELACQSSVVGSLNEMSA